MGQYAVLNQHSIINQANNIKRPVHFTVPIEITNTNNGIKNNKKVNEPAKDKKRRSRREAAKLNQY